MASLAAIRALAEEWLAGGKPLDILVNNAGLMLHERTPSADGYETNVRAAGSAGHSSLRACRTGVLLASGCCETALLPLPPHLRALPRRSRSLPSTRWARLPSRWRWSPRCMRPLGAPASCLSAAAAR